VLLLEETTLKGARARCMHMRHVSLKFNL